MPSFLHGLYGLNSSGSHAYKAGTLWREVSSQILVSYEYKKVLNRDGTIVAYGVPFMIAGDWHPVCRKLLEGV